MYVYCVCGYCCLRYLWIQMYNTQHNLTPPRPPDTKPPPPPPKKTKQDHGFSTWFWRLTLIYVGAAAIFQANLAVSAWTIFLNTGHQIKVRTPVDACSSIWICVW